MNKLLCVSICFVATFGWVIRFSSPSVVVQSTLSGFPVSRNICLRNFLTCVDKNASVEINLKTGPYCPSYRGVRLIKLNLFSINTRLFQVVELSKPAN